MGEHDRDVREAAVALLASGQMTIAEVVMHAGVSPQIVRYWARAAGVNYRKVRLTKTAALWRKALDNGSRLAERPRKKG